MKWPTVILYLCPELEVGAALEGFVGSMHIVLLVDRVKPLVLGNCGVNWFSVPGANLKTKGNH
jgi:hypothetical protein